MIKLNRRALIALAAATALTPVMTPAFAQETTTATTVADPGDFSLGSPDAKVKIVEYASYTCPHCAAFHAAVFKDLKKDYIDTGKVYFTLREFYRNRYDLWASMVARCGGEMRYFGIHDMLFDQQDDWGTTEDATAALNKIKTIGLAAGLDQASVDACVNDQTKAEALIKQFETNAAADDVQGTPTVFVNGMKQSSVSYDELKAIIDAELAK
jgi:protein-disulfide isomerase